MITSVSNAKVKLVRSLARRRARYAARQFVIEGMRTIEETVRAGIAPALVFYVSALEQDPRAGELLERLRTQTPEVHPVTDAVMQAMTNTETPPGLLAVCPFIELPLPRTPRLLMILDAIRDPGNVGTILRSAWAAGVDVVYFAPGAADPYNDKVVRAAMGAHFHLPLRVEYRWDAIKQAVSNIPRIYLADAKGEIDYRQADWSRPLALIIGAEAEGASSDARQVATARVRIPMHAGAESLNAAMAATLLLFQAA